MPPPLLTLTILLAALVAGVGCGMGLNRKKNLDNALTGLTVGTFGGLAALYLFPKAVYFLNSFPLALLICVLPIAWPAIYAKIIGRPFKGRAPARELVWAAAMVYLVYLGVSSVRNNLLGFGLAGAFLCLLLGAAVIRLFSDSPKQYFWRVAGLAGAVSFGVLISSMPAPDVYLFLNSENMNQVTGCVYSLICGCFLYLLKDDFLVARAKHDSSLPELLGFTAALLAWLWLGGVFNQGPLPDFELTAASTDAILLFLSTLLVLTKETAHYLLFGLIISGLLHAYMPSSPVEWLKRGNALTQSLKGMTFGLPLPICSCGVLPLFLSLSKKGAPPACLTAFLIATPELGVDSFLLSVKLLGWKFSIVRLAIAMILPVVIALIAVRFIQPPAVMPEEEKSCCASAGTSKPPWWHFAFKSLADDIFPFVFFGLGIAALAQIMWPETRFQELIGQWDVLLLGLLGIPFYVCASASVPFALILLNHGFSVGAVVVFLFAGPATNIATVMTVNKAFGEGSGLKLAAIALVCAVSCGFLINAVYSPENLDLMSLHNHGWSPLNVAAVVGLLTLCLYSLGRLGPLKWLSVQVSMIPGLKPPPKSSCH